MKRKYYRFTPNQIERLLLWHYYNRCSKYNVKESIVLLGHGNRLIKNPKASDKVAKRIMKQ